MVLLAGQALAVTGNVDDVIVTICWANDDFTENMIGCFETP